MLIERHVIAFKVSALLHTIPTCVSNLGTNITPPVGITKFCYPNVNRVSNEHRKHTHPQQVQSLRVDLTAHPNIQSPLLPFWLVSCLGKDPCLGSPKLGRKGRYLV